MNEYTAKGGVSRAHSDNGNLRDDGTRLFDYDVKNRLVAVWRKSDNAPIAVYLYYPNNRRAKTTVYSQTVPGQVQKETLFFYDGWQVCEEQAGSGATELTYVYSPVYIDEPVQLLRTASHPLGSGTLYLHQNARADVVAVTDSTGQLVEKRLYDDFGRSFDEQKQPADLIGSAQGNPYGFQGRRLDPETGLYYFRNRYYDTRSGRFLQRDPVWDAGNFGGQYTFVGNGPASGRDPRGTQPLGAGSDKAAEAEMRERQRERLARAMRAFQQGGFSSADATVVYFNVADVPKRRRIRVALDQLGGAYITELKARTSVLARYVTEELLPLDEFRKHQAYERNKTYGGYGLKDPDYDPSYVPLSAEVFGGPGKFGRAKSGKFCPKPPGPSTKLRDVLSRRAEKKRRRDLRRAGTAQHSVGENKPPLIGQPSKSLHTRVAKSDPSKAVQNTIYDPQGRATAHVDFKTHGGVPSGHAHIFPPGKPQSGHGAGSTHVDPADVPPAWTRLPPNVSPIQ